MGECFALYWPSRFACRVGQLQVIGSLNQCWNKVNEDVLILHTFVHEYMAAPTNVCPECGGTLMLVPQAGGRLICVVCGSQSQVPAYLGRAMPQGQRWL